MERSRSITFSAILTLLAGCATVPTGPGVLVLPGTGKSARQFGNDDAVCRQAARLQIETSPSLAATASGIGSAAVGMTLGAAVGAALGGARGAAVGAGAGLISGSLAGTDTAADSYHETQKRYDIVYIQCMYAKGHRVPIPNGLSYAERNVGPPPPSPVIPPPAAAP